MTTKYRCCSYRLRTQVFYSQAWLRTPPRGWSGSEAQFPVNVMTSGLSSVMVNVIGSRKIAYYDLDFNWPSGRKCIHDVDDMITLEIGSFRNSQHNYITIRRWTAFLHNLISQYIDKLTNDLTLDHANTREWSLGICLQFFYSRLLKSMERRPIKKMSCFDSARGRTS